MKINFIYNNQQYNFPDNEKHIDIQSNLRKKIEELLEPISAQLEVEPTGHLDVKYNDNNLNRSSIEIFGFSGDNTVKIVSLLNTIAK